MVGQLKKIDVNIIYAGHALRWLRCLPDNSINCCVTSPPYWGLRDYGTGIWDGGDINCNHKPSETENKRGLQGSTLMGGKKTTGHQQEGFKIICPKCGAKRTDEQIGLEETPEEFVRTLVEIFTEVYRVLTPDGTLWLNLGDSYASIAGGYNNESQIGIHNCISKNTMTAVIKNKNSKPPKGYKPKDLIGIPWMVAFALRAAGWYLRQDIIWHKPNPMPESVGDRCTKSHEYVFLFSKSHKYHFDAKAISEPAVKNENRKSFRGTGKYVHDKSFANDTAVANQTKGNEPNEKGMRNKRSVWTVATKPFMGLILLPSRKN